jgi:D-3-phosphoglycerate dehydrogenase
MNVIGYDPFISVEAAWSLSRAINRAETIEALLAKADYITLHVPLMEGTKGFINAEKIRIMKKGARIINLARGGLVNDADLLEALAADKLGAYVTDFPNAELLGNNKIICVPHLGASTPEAEDNCAFMAVQQLMDFLENGNIKNSVNFPMSKLEQRAPHRLLVINRNIPNMVGQISTHLADANINIMDLVNHHKNDFAYNIIDTEQEISAAVQEKLSAVDGVIRVRTIDAE